MQKRRYCSMALVVIAAALPACSDGDGHENGNGDAGPDCIPQATKACWPEAGVGADVRWYDSCGNPGMLAADCPDIRSECTETADLVRCECLTHWEGDDCDECPAHWDPEQDCDACLGNWDEASGCTTCVEHWDLATNCTTCLSHWDPATGCTSCLDPWEGEQCQSLAGFDFWPCALASACLAGEQQAHFGGYCNEFFMIAALGDQSRSTEFAGFKSLMACITDAADCDEMRACMEASPEEAAVCAGPSEYHCVGDVRVSCPFDTGEPTRRTDCAAAGLVCGQIGTRADCGVSPCDPVTDANYCDGDLTYECRSSGVWQIRDCAFDTAGLCVDLGGGNITCAGSGAACDSSTHVSRCEGSATVSCRGGQEALIDCSIYNEEMTCTVVPDGDFATCIFPENECSWDTSETCTEGVIRFCLMGRFFEADCTVYGFSGCATERVNGFTIAHCVE